MRLSREQLQAFTFLQLGELKDICCDLGVMTGGRKGQLIARIVHFLQTGESVAEPLVPAISMAPLGQALVLAREALVLKGSYRGNPETRAFLQSLIGEHFHFTAFGQDWLQEQWMVGAPPTYQEFAHMWQAEYERRISKDKTPKQEWAYLRFSQNFLRQHPHVSRPGVLQAWERERQRQKSLVKQLLQEWRLS